ncbi:MAG: ATP synthase F1 subunit delta [Caldilineaceae bacterium]|nr:ATP synthase F1 subunit delta [Nitrospira sp.]MCL4858884.1 ATP synthase F1 subunit delta [Caldilineaceae bacterium]
MSDKSARANQYAQAIVAAMLERWQAALAQAAQGLGKGKKADVDAVVPADAPPELVNALKLMQERGDLDLIPDVSEALSRTMRQQREPVKAEVVSAVELSANEQEQLRQALVAEHGEGLLFSFRVDPALLGGLRVRVGDRLIDTSVASRLTALRESLASVVR